MDERKDLEPKAAEDGAEELFVQGSEGESAVVALPAPLMKKERGHRTNREAVMGWIFSCIPLVGFLIFGMVPLALSLYISLNHFPGLKLHDVVSEWGPAYSQLITFMGFGNFKLVLTDPLFWKAVLNTLFVVLTTVIALAVSVFISMMLYNCGKGKKFFQTVYFIPYVCSLVAVTFMWRWIFSPESGGILNSIVQLFGGQPQKWYNYSPDRFRAVMFVILLWSGTGFNIILLSAALTNVNKSCYEAADIDGAGMFTKFFKITLPAISPTLFYLLITGIIGSLQEFTRFQTLVGENEAAVGNANITIVYYLFQRMTMRGSPTDIKGIGVASAVGWILAVMIGLVTLANFQISKKWVSYDE